MEPELTEVMIAATKVRAELRVCVGRFRRNARTSDPDDQTDGADPAAAAAGAAVVAGALATPTGAAVGCPLGDDPCGCSRPGVQGLAGLRG